MIDFTLRQIEHFVAIAESGTYRVAAEATHTAQPALSVSIRKLEDALGVVLFERGARGVRLTAAGHAFLVEAHRTLRQAGAAREAAQMGASGRSGLVRVGFVGSAVYQLLPATLPAFAALYPSVKLELQESNSVEIVQQLRGGDLDVGFVRTPLDDVTGLHLTEVETDDLVAVLPVRHPLARGRSLRLRQLHAEPFVMFSRAHVPGLRGAVIAACRTAGFVPVAAQEATQAVTVVGLVGSGLGVALVPGVVARFASREARFLRVADKAARKCLSVSMAVLREGASPATMRFCEAVAGRPAVR